jgi:Protein of unknown function (DUF1549)/Protein of unknown function (DUF1553)
MRILSLTFAALSLAILARAEPPAERWWAFTPLISPPVPKSAATHPVDTFIQAKLTDKGLSPSLVADRRTLIRRLAFDLTGLPPTPVEVDAFAKDASPNAYEKLVDRLLASPHYGERQARQWMDVAHFAETHGHDQDRVRPNAWRYRDYLIDAFNADRPYARFVQEQIAGDVLFPNEPQLLPALGFLAAGPWDESSLRDIREDSIDREIARYLDRDDMISTAMGTFVSLTVGCARCHDHKFDPISIDDYYRLQAVFAGVGRGNVAFDVDPSFAKKRRELTASLKAIDANDVSVKSRLTNSGFLQELQAWEKQQSAKLNPWQSVEIVSAVEEQGSTLTAQPDGSLRAISSKRPEREVYVVTFRSKLPHVSALRLELLTDDKFPHRGPGLQDNGNLHLSEVKIVHRKEPIALGTPTSDWDQDGWTVRHAVDGNPATAWGIYPKVGVPHEAVFPFAKPVGGDTFTVRLEQLHGGGHLIGRFRLSATAEANASLTQPLPPFIAETLKTPEEKRTDKQTNELRRHVYRLNLTKELAALPAQQFVYVAAANFEPDGSHKPIAKPRAVHLLKRGDIRKLGDEMAPATLSCVPELPGEFALAENHSEGDRRAALAKWLSDSKNPLVWRSIVNRVWQQHFGRGIVDTPNDFGKMGGKPSHPELLDYMAVWFRDEAKGSLKKLHKLIVTSSTYRQQSAHNAKAATTDEDNRLLWRMPRTKLDAEQVRDAILLASGRLDTRRGGPSDQQFAMKPGIHVTPTVDYGAFDWDRPQGHRRSVYRFVFRTLPDPLVDCLDGADASQQTPKRNESVTAPQSLAMLNNDFILSCAKAMAKVADVEEACHRLWGRPPTEIERKELNAYAAKHGLANACRMLMNSNEFLFVD